MYRIKHTALQTIKAALLLLLVALMLGIPFPARAEGGDSLTLLFTSDIHSNVVPHLALLDGKGARLGGFARLKTAVDERWQEGRTLLLDSGDFSMGTLYQSYTQSDALELTLMERIGYDAVALGNHDFELGEEGLIGELSVFSQGGGDMALLCSNLTDGDKRITTEQNGNPLSAYGVQNYTILERGGLRIGIFALMGNDAISYTPDGVFSFADPIETAKAMTAHLRENEHADLVIALSHAGTMPDGSFHEDADIAAAVEGIDVMLSGHEHIPLMEIEYVNNTMIVCAGTALNYLGSLTLTKRDGGWSGAYELIPLTDGIAEDAETANLIAEYTAAIDSDYLAPMGVTKSGLDEFAISDFDLIDGDHMCLELKNYPFSALICDAYFDGLTKAGVKGVVAAAVPVGFVRNGLYRGKLTVMDAYNVLSYGISPFDGSCGAPLCIFYLNGSELYNLCETSVSLSGLVNSAQMLLGGIRFQYSDSRLILNRVYRVEAQDPASGAYSEVERNDKKLYKVAASWTALQNLSLLGEKSYGLVSIVPKDEKGNAYTAEDLKNAVVRRSDGKELKEWYALYDYIASMPPNGEGLSVLDARYGEEPGYMTEGGSGVALFFQNPGKVFWLLLGAAVLLLLLTAFLIRLVVKLCTRRAKGKVSKPKDRS